MTFLCVEWLHNIPTEPIKICAELDEERFEVRKIEFFMDGTKVKVSKDLPELNSTRLSIEPWPDNNDIVSNPDESFILKEVAPEEFESLWNS